MRRIIETTLPLVPILVAIVALTANPRRATADDAAVDAQERAEKCATRLSVAMVGESASAGMLASATPQSSFDTLATDPRFIERFARFVNQRFNVAPGATPAEDAAYYLTKYVLQNGKPWSDMFVGGYDVAPSDPNTPTSDAVVTTNANGLGYFRSRAWAVRYAGNEQAGIRIVTANRIMQNTIGLKLTAVTTSPGMDISANGRKGGVCAQCHYDKWYALDKTASVLGTRTGTGTATQFTAPAVGPQQILGGVTVSNDKELVQALVANEAFDVNVCRISFNYLYGRDENSCEGPLFDKCVDAFKGDGKIQTALATVAKDASFCE